MLRIRVRWEAALTVAARHLFPYLVHQSTEAGHVNHFESLLFAGEQRQGGASGSVDELESFVVGHRSLRDRIQREIHQKLHPPVASSFLCDREILAWNIHTSIMIGFRDTCDGELSQ